MDTQPPPYRHPRRWRVAGCFRYEIGHSATLATLDTLFPRSFFSSREKSCDSGGGGHGTSLARYARIRARDSQTRVARVAEGVCKVRLKRGEPHCQKQGWRQNHCRLDLKQTFSRY